MTHVGRVTRVLSPALIEVQIGNAIVMAIVPLVLAGIDAGDWVHVQKDDGDYVVMSWSAQHGL